MTVKDVFEGLNAIKGYLYTVAFLLTFIGGATWVVAKPYVEAVIVEAVTNSRNFATTVSMQSIDQNVQQMTIELEAIQKRLESGDLTDQQIKRQLEDLRSLQLRTNELILRSLME